MPIIIVRNLTSAPLSVSSHINLRGNETKSFVLSINVIEELQQSKLETARNKGAISFEVVPEPEVDDDLEGAVLSMLTGLGGGTVKVSSNDTTAEYLATKVVAGVGVTVTELNDGGVETLEISAATGGTDELVKVSINDTTAGYLASKIAAGTNMTVTETNDGANESVTLDSTFSSELLWGANSVASSVTTRYLSPAYDDRTAETSPTQIRLARAGTIQNLRVRHNAPAGNGNDVVYTLRINGVASALTASLASTSSDASDLVNTVVVAAGDLADIEVTKAASIGSSPINITATLEFAS